MLLNKFVLRAIRLAGAESAIDLRKRRVWFDDQQGDDKGEDDAKTKDKPESKYDPASLDEALKIIRALEARLGERDAKIDSITARMTAIETAQTKKLEEEGNHLELRKQAEARVAELEPLAARATSLEAIIRESNKARIEKIPEDRRTIIPVDDLSPEKLQVWLNKSEALLIKPPAPDFDGGAGRGSGGSGEPKLTDGEREAAKMFGLKEEDMLKVKNKENATPFEPEKE